MNFKDLNPGDQFKVVNHISRFDKYTADSVFIKVDLDVVKTRFKTTNAIKVDDGKEYFFPESKEVLRV